MNSIPSELKQELNIPLSDLDGLLDRLDTEMSLENVEMENRLRTIMKSRLLIDRLNEAVSVLKDKPTDGDLMYEVIYRTTIASHHPATLCSHRSDYSFCSDAFVI